MNSLNQQAKYKFLLLLLLFPILSYSQVVGKVSWVYDGDTFKVKTDTLGEIKVRIADIDCPESDQDYGKDAKDFLVKLIWKKEVSLLIKEKDRYGRYIAHVMVDTLNVNQILVQEGYAWHYKKYSSDLMLSVLEEKARQERKGLWKASNPVPPWEFRKR